MLRHIAVGVVVLLALVLGAAWAVPPWLDGDRFRDEVAELASAALGQAVRIDGAITVRVLPQPLLVAERVSVVGGVNVTAEQLVLRVGLGPLLAGRVDARELVLRGAEIRLPWPMEPSALALRTPSWLSALSARIERGRLWLGEVELSGLEATLATSDLSGSFYSAGRVQGGGREWMFTARVSRPGGDGAVGIDLTLDGQGASRGIGAVVSGQMQGDGTMLGRVAVRGPDLSQLLPAPAVAFRAEGRLSSGGGLIAADEVLGELAGSPVQGAVALRLAPVVRLDVAVTASRLDGDAWVVALQKYAEGGARPVLPVGLDISAEAATLAGGTLRALRGAVDITGGAVSLREARAVLPGDAALRLSGRLMPGGGGRFEGEAQLDAPALRSTLVWAAGAWGPGMGLVDSLPPGVLQRGVLAGKVVLEDGQLVLSEVAGTVDGARVAASLSWRPGQGAGQGAAARPALRAMVALQRLELDPWLAAFGQPAFGQMGQWTGLLGAGLGGVSLDLKLEAARAGWRGVELAAVALDLATEPGRVMLRRLEASGLGAMLSASGTLLEGGRLADAKAELRGAGLAPELAAWMGAEASGWLAPLLRGPWAMQVQGGGAPDALGLKLAGDLGDLRIEATPVADLPRGRWAGHVMLHHPGAPRLAEMLGVAGTRAWLGDGSFGLVAHLAVGPERIVADSFDLTAGGLRAGGALRLERGAIPKLSGQVAAERLPVPRADPHSADPLPLAALMGWEAAVQITAKQVLVAQGLLLREASATVTLAAGRLELARLAAKLGGGSLTGAVSLDAAARPPALAGTVTLAGVTVAAPVFDAALDLAEGILDGAVRVSASGFSPAGLLASLGGRAAIVVRDGMLTGIDLARMGTRLAEDDLRAALAGGSTGFARLVLEADVDRGGVALTEAVLSGPAGTATASGTIDLGRALMALRLAIVPAVPDAPEIGLRLSGPAAAPERVPELAGAMRWRAERP